MIVTDIVNRVLLQFIVEIHNHPNAPHSMRSYHGTSSLTECTVFHVLVVTPATRLIIIQGKK